MVSLENNAGNIISDIFQMAENLFVKEHCRKCSFSLMTINGTNDLLMFIFMYIINIRLIRASHTCEQLVYSR